MMVAALLLACSSSSLRTLFLAPRDVQVLPSQSACHGKKGRWRTEAQTNTLLLQRLEPLFWLAENAAELGRQALEDT